MKKFLLFILTIINLAQMPIALATPIQHENLVAVVILQEDMKPANSPGIVFGNNAIKNVGQEGAFGNYLLQMLAGGLITLAAPIAIIIIAIAGLIAVISHGDTKLMDQAKKTLTNAVIGLVIIIFSWVVIRGVISLVISTNQNQPAQTNSTAPAPAPAPSPSPTPAQETVVEGAT